MPSNARSKPIKTLRMPEGELANLRDELDRQEGRSKRGKKDQKTEPENHRYEIREGLEIHVDHPGGSRICYLVRPRILGAKTLRFLHGHYLYPNVKCEVALKTIDNEKVLVAGMVFQCRHVQGNVHDVGVRFEETVDLSNFVRALAMPEPPPVPAALPTVAAELPAVPEPSLPYDPLEVMSIAGQLKKMAERIAPMENVVAKLAELAQVLHEKAAQTVNAPAPEATEGSSEAIENTSTL